MLLGFDASVDLEAVLEDEADDAFAETFWSSRRRTFGMYAVRGSSLPFDAIFGVPIWRESSIPVFSSMRSSASSIHRKYCLSTLERVRVCFERTSNIRLEIRILHTPRLNL